MGPINKEVMHIGETPGKAHDCFIFARRISRALIKV
jgi:hypothetical protein